MKKYVLGILICVLSIHAANAQVKIDVKTSIKVKEHFSIYKTGIIQMLEQSSLFKVVNTGEDYSLWLTGFNSYTSFGQRYVSATIQLRTSAFFTHGKLIDGRTLTDNYDPTTFSNANNVQDLAQKMGSMRKLKVMVTNLSLKADKMAAGYAQAMTGLPAMQVFNTLISKVNTSFGQRPTAIDLSDSIFLGGVVTTYLYNMTYK